MLNFDGDVDANTDVKCKQGITVNERDGVVEEVGHENPVDDGCTEQRDDGERDPHVLSPASPASTDTRPGNLLPPAPLAALPNVK